MPLRRPSIRQTRRTIAWMRQQYSANKSHRNVYASRAETVDVWGYRNELHCCSTGPYRCHDPDRRVHRGRPQHRKNQFRMVYRSVQSPLDAKFHANRMHSIVRRGNSAPFAVVALAPWTIWLPCTSTRLFCTKIPESPNAFAIDPIRRLHSIWHRAHHNRLSYRCFQGGFVSILVARHWLHCFRNARDKHWTITKWKWINDSISREKRPHRTQMTRRDRGASNALTSRREYAPTNLADDYLSHILLHGARFRQKCKKLKRKKRRQTSYIAL